MSDADRPLRADYAAGVGRVVQVVALLSFTLFLLLAASLTALFTSQADALSETLVATEARAEILRLDELLTSAAEMAAATGDPRWAARHAENVPRLDDALRRAGADDPAAGRAVADLSAANDALLVLESQAFALARAGRLEESRALLHGADYQRQKRRYQDGVAAIDQGLRARADAARRTARSCLLLASGLLVAAAGLSLVGARRFSTRLGQLRRAHLAAEEAADLARADVALATSAGGIGLIRGGPLRFRGSELGLDQLGIDPSGARELSREDLPPPIAAALVADGGAPRRIELTWRTGAGRTLLVRGSTDPEGFAAAVIDVTAQAEAERALRELTTELERQVAARTAQLSEQVERNRLLALQVAEAEIAERRRLATILHDELQQGLVATRLHLQSGSPRELLMQIFDRTLSTSRALATDLMPPAEDGDLADAIEEVCALFARWHRLDVVPQVAARPAVERAQIDVCHSVIRELLFNVVKHAPGARVTVRLEARAGHAVIGVTDTGPGFDPSGPAGLGLPAARHRAAAMGGSLSIASRPGDGTHVELSVPLAAPLLPPPTAVPPPP